MIQEAKGACLGQKERVKLMRRGVAAERTGELFGRVILARGSLFRTHLLGAQQAVAQLSLSQPSIIPL